MYGEFVEIGNKKKGIWKVWVFCTPQSSLFEKQAKATIAIDKVKRGEDPGTEISYHRD